MYIRSIIRRLFQLIRVQKDAASPGADLEDMQSLLYLLEEGDAHLRAGRLNLALKKYVAVQKVRVGVLDHMNEHLNLIQGFR